MKIKLKNTYFTVQKKDRRCHRSKKYLLNYTSVIYEAVKIKLTRKIQHKLIVLFIVNILPLFYNFHNII